MEREAKRFARRIPRLLKSLQVAEESANENEKMKGKPSDLKENSETFEKLSCAEVAEESANENEKMKGKPSDLKGEFRDFLKSFQSSCPLCNRKEAVQCFKGSNSLVESEQHSKVSQTDSIGLQMESQHIGEVEQLNSDIKKSQNDEERCHQGGTRRQGRLYSDRSMRM
ncbi:unnamed protein product, partial [Mesorhabditis belari]|uniref:Uncharacterized protein n=1 Tax=Mesorhabditis belari TaxID=2138241 RepID=A0AAF3FA96_9BILA